MKGNYEVMKFSISEMLMHSTIRIEILNENKQVVSTGTGFFFDFKINDKYNVPVLVTNKHVIKDAQIGRLVFTISKEGKPVYGEKFMYEIQAFEELFILHPEQDVDLCVMPINPVVKDAQIKYNKTLFYISLGESIIAHKEQLEGLNALEDIIMIGYPNGLWEEILAACDTSLFLGCNDETSAKYYSEKSGISTIEVGTEQRSLKTLRITDYTPEVRQSEGEGKRYVNNPDELQRFKYKDELIFCKGFNVFRCNKFDYELHPEAKKLEYEKAIEHVPEWRKREEPYQLYVLRYIPGTEAFDRKAFAAATGDNKEHTMSSSTSKGAKKNTINKPHKNKKSKRGSSWANGISGQQQMNYNLDKSDETEEVTPTISDSENDAINTNVDFNEAENGAENVNDQTPDFGDTSVEEMMNQYGL